VREARQGRLEAALADVAPRADNVGPDFNLPRPGAGGLLPADNPLLPDRLTRDETLTQSPDGGDYSVLALAGDRIRRKRNPSDLGCNHLLHQDRHFPRRNPTRLSRVPTQRLHSGPACRGGCHRKPHPHPVCLAGAAPMSPHHELLNRIDHNDPIGPRDPRTTTDDCGTAPLKC